MDTKQAKEQFGLYHPRRMLLEELSSLLDNLTPLETVNSTGDVARAFILHHHQTLRRFVDIQPAVVEILRESFAPYNVPDEALISAAMCSIFRAHYLLSTSPAGVWRIGEHYGIHVYEGERPVATFHDQADAEQCVRDRNAIYSNSSWQQLTDRLSREIRELEAREATLRAALKAARGWIVTCSESAQARSDLKQLDDALSQPAPGDTRRMGEGPVDWLRTDLYTLRERAAEEARDGPADAAIQGRALCAYEWLGDNIEAFLDDREPAEKYSWIATNGEKPNVDAFKPFEVKTREGKLMSVYLHSTVWEQYGSELDIVAYRVPATRPPEPDQQAIREAREDEPWFRADPYPKSQGPILRAMALNYTAGHSWDHLDTQAVSYAADEIVALRAAIAARAAAQRAVVPASSKEKLQRREPWAIGDEVEYCVHQLGGPSKGSRGLVVEIEETHIGRPRSQDQVFWVRLHNGQDTRRRTGPDEVKLVRAASPESTK